jgi:glycosyltransferase involved in cell wall biosynthesis
MKIAIYVQDMRASGVVRTMMAMARSFAASDEVVLLAGYADGLFGAGDVAPASFVAAAGKARRGLIPPRLAVVPRLRRALRAQRPEVVLSGGNFGHFSLWAATLGLAVPVVYVFSNAMERRGQPWRNRWRRVWSALLVRGSAGTIVVGADMARSPVFAPHIARGKAVLIPNGLDLTTVPAPDGVVPEPMEGTDPVILSIGRLQPQKNFEGLIDAVAVLACSRPVRLVILGAGSAEYRDTLVARATDRGIGARTVFAGVTDDVFPWLRAARVFALASHWEGSSIALLEAMAAGVPIVAARTAGDAADVLGDGRYGRLADPADPEAFAAALCAQIDSPVLPASRIGDYDAAAMMRAYHRMVTAVPGQRGAAPPPAWSDRRPSR